VAKMAAIDWEFSVRVSNVLRDAGIDTHEKLMNLTDRELLCLRNFGKRSLDEIWEYRRKQLDKIRDGALVKRFLSRINSLTRQVENLRRENRRLLTDLEKTREQSRQVISRLRRELADARGEAAVALNGEDVVRQTIVTSAWWNTAGSN
jgi:Bacterial RNA polymerase, alpha chain C terminal domain